MRTKNKIWFCALLGGQLAACSSDSTRGRQDAQSAATSPAADQVAKPGPVSPVTPAPTEPKPEAKSPGPITASYLAKVRGAGLDVCGGSVNLEVDLMALSRGSTSFFQVPSSDIVCALIGAIDIKAVLAAFSRPADVGSSELVVKDGIIHVPSFAGNTYQPARPLFPALFSAEPDVLRRLNTQQTLTLTTKEGLAVSGVTAVAMKSYDQPFTLASTKRVYPHTLNFVVTNSGFTGIDRTAALLFDSMEFRISMDPLAILGVTFTGTVAQVVTAVNAAQGAAAGSFGNGFLGFVAAPFAASPVVLTLDLAQDPAEALAAPIGDNGETIGGQAVP